MVEKLLYDKYNIIAKSVEKTNVGAGSDTYFIDTTTGKYVMKFPCSSNMNHPLNEPNLCQYLLDRNINACRFIKNINNEYISYDENGRLFHLQKFILGKIYDWNTAPEWLLKESAENLGKIHSALKNYSIDLPSNTRRLFYQSIYLRQWFYKCSHRLDNCLCSSCCVGNSTLLYLCRTMLCRRNN